MDLRKKKHVWQAPILRVVASFESGHNGCARCSGRRASKEHNLATKYPEQVKEFWHEKRNEFRPYTVTPGCDRLAWWHCPKSPEHVWQSPISQVTKNWSRGGRGCPFCTGARVAPSERLFVLYPELAKYWHPSRNLLNPLDIGARGRRIIWWRCPKSHTWQEQLRTILRHCDNGTTVCPRCR